MQRLLLLVIALSASCAAGCRSVPRPGPGQSLARAGDEMVVCGHLFHTGTPVVTWLDPGGYDAYRVERKFAPADKADWKASQAENPHLESPNRYGFRKSTRLDAARLERVRTNGWDLDSLKLAVDQFVIHYDVSGTSRRCFQTLHDQRGLSVHFLLDVDGTLYQTLDLKERAWHATSSNTRAIGIEIAQVGAVPLSQRQRLDSWYSTHGGKTRLTIPEYVGATGVRTEGFAGHPARDEAIQGTIQGSSLIQYDFTPEQYSALAHLVATLCRVFPQIRCDYPHDLYGKVIPEKLPDDQLANYSGLLGHYHIQKDKVDPGPAFQWDRVVREARELIQRELPLQPALRPAR